MATLTIHTERILENIEKLSSYLHEQGIQWTLITKMLCGYKPVIEQIVQSECVKSLHSLGDSRISNLKIVKEFAPEVQTMYVKPPAMSQASNIVKYADVSLNTTAHTIAALNEQAKKQGKIHKIIVMVELGELREGIMRDNVMEFYEEVFSLPHIKVIGLGTNLGCMHGIEPSYDKLIQLSLYRQLIEAQFSQKLELISGGSSITLPLISRKKLPPGIEHFRIGETAFLGVSLDTNKKFRNLSTAAFDFAADILEVEKKSILPDGVRGDAGIGKIALPEDEEKDSDSYRCIVDFGQIDVDFKDLTPKDKSVIFAGTTSDMTVYNVGTNKNKYRVGKQIHFAPGYMAIARLMHSRYVTKKCAPISAKKEEEGGEAEGQKKNEENKKTPSEVNVAQIAANALKNNKRF